MWYVGGIVNSLILATIGAEGLGARVRLNVSTEGRRAKCMIYC